MFGGLGALAGLLEMTPQRYHGWVIFFFFAIPISIATWLVLTLPEPVKRETQPPARWVQAKEAYEQCLEEAPQGVFCLTEIKEAYWLSVNGVDFIRGVNE